MFYEPSKRDHGLPFSPLKAIVAPRPIGWISTLSRDGVANLAPYSFFNLISEDPALVMFSSVGRKHSVVNAEETGEFVCNLATIDLIDAVNLSSAEISADKSEFEHAGVEQAPSRLVKPPRVAEAPCALECVYVETLRPKDRHGHLADRHMVMGEIIGVYVNEAFIRHGRVDTALMGALARCGYRDFSAVEELVERPRPDDPK